MNSLTWLSTLLTLASGAAEEAADALAKLATCGDDEPECACPARPGDDDPPELERAINAFESVLGDGQAEWEPEAGCYWAHASRVWRGRADRLRAAAEALAVL